VEDDVLKNVRFIGGCDGNLKGISMLVKGMKVPDVIEKLRGIDCGGRGRPARISSPRRLR
jgi:uncharacterized protein (TIGR03905 family)